MKLFLGLIFVLLDIKIPVGTMQVGLLPDFIGYFLIMKGLEARLDPWRHGAFGLMLVSLVLYAADLLAMDSGVRIAFWCVALAAEIGMLFPVHRIACGGKGTRELFPVLACFCILAAALDWVPLVGTVCVIAGAAVSICFLAAAYQSLVKGR